MTSRSRKYIVRQKRKSVRMRFDDNPEHDIVIPDIRKFRGVGNVVRLSTGEIVSVEPDEPVPSGREYIYTVKVVDPQYPHKGPWISWDEE